MKTKDFIKMLQDEDPSGEGHVRFTDGVPYRCEAKEGYWDGAYLRMNGDKLEHTKADYKIDFYFENTESMMTTWMSKNYNSYKDERSLDELWKQICDDCYLGFDEKGLNDIRKTIEFDWYVDYVSSLDNKFLDEIMDFYNKGGTVFKKIHSTFKYHGDWRFEADFEHSMSPVTGTTKAILDSGRFSYSIVGDEHKFYPI